MNRREIIGLLGATSAVWPRATQAQQPEMPVVGLLGTTSAENFVRNVGTRSALHAGLKESGYVEGRNVAFAYRWAEGDYARLPILATELVALKVAVIFGVGIAATQAAWNATRTVPIVFSVNDPVELGLVASYNRPGGNATGVDNFLDLFPKQLGMLREMLPNARSVGFIRHPGNPSAARQVASVQAAASTTGFDIQVLEARTESEIEQAFARIAERRAEALLLSPEPFFFAQREQIAALAARLAIPAVYVDRSFVAAGGLMSYGADVRDVWRLVGVYVGKILAGAKPSDLPVQRPTKVELVINAKAAKALGLVMPPSMLARADEVIE
jgi:putative ABC transport system substrate-binding protein